MKASYTLLFFLLVSVEIVASSTVRGRAHAVRIPEHSCHKLIGSNKCELQKCIQECSKEPSGVGVCKNTTCFCTYYCKDPPKQSLQHSQCHCLMNKNTIELQDPYKKSMLSTCDRRGRFHIMKAFRAFCKVNRIMKGTPLFVSLSSNDS